MKWICVAIFCFLFSPAALAVILSGRVSTETDDKPLSNAMVLVRGTGLFAATGTDGSYSIAKVPAGMYGITCSAKGFMGRSLGAVDLLQDHNRNFRLPAPGTEALHLSGTTQCDGSACAGILVRVRQNSHTFSAISALDGSFSLPGLAEGAAQVQAVGLGYRMAELDAHPISKATPSATLDLVSMAPSTLSGYIGLSDNPLLRDGSSLSLFGQSLTVQSDHGGAYTLTLAPAGLLSLQASHPGYRTQTQIDVLVQGDRSLNFVLHKPGTGPEITYRITGRVTLANPEGDPTTALATRVSLWAESSDFLKTTATDESGNFRFESIPGGTYSLGAALKGYLSQTSAAFDLHGNRSLNLELQSDPNASEGPGTEAIPMGCSQMPSSLGILPFLLLILFRFGRTQASGFLSTTTKKQSQDFTEVSSPCGKRYQRR
jgi:hypothetical protein